MAERRQDIELNAIRRVLRRLEALEPEARLRVARMVDPSSPGAAIESTDEVQTVASVMRSLEHVGAFAVPRMARYIRERVEGDVSTTKTSSVPYDGQATDLFTEATEVRDG